MKLTSQNILLQSIESKDIDFIHSKTSDYSQVGKYFTTKIRSKSYWLKKYKENGLWDDNSGTLKIVDRNDNQIIGLIWYFKSLPYIEGYEISFNIFSSSKRSKGFAAESVKLFSSYLFNAYNIPRLQCNTYISINHPSIENFTKTTGFTFDGTMKNAMYIRGKLIDLNLFSLLKHESQKLEEFIYNQT